MTRLFVTLYLMILAAAFGFMFSINPVLQYTLKNAQLNYVYTTFNGVFYLLDQRLGDAGDPSLTLREIQNDFEYEVKLIPMTDFAPDSAELKSLQQHQVVVRELDKADFVYARSKVKTDHVWSLQISQTSADDSHALVIGPVKLLEQILQRFPVSAWPEQLATVQETFGVRMSLLEQDSEELNDFSVDNKQDLANGRVIGFDVEESEGDERYYYQLTDSNWILKIGPIEQPAFEPYVLLMVFGILSLLLATVIFLWIRPLWQNLSSLDRAAKAFGAGDFSARTEQRRLNPVKSLSTTFNQMAGRVQALISSHKDLTNAVSHEIRTPLARMRFGLEMLETADNERDKQRFAQEMATDIDELDALVGELLTYARFERAKPQMHLDQHIIVPWFQQQIQRAQKLSDHVEITLHHEGISLAQSAQFEDRLLARALSNLLRNGLQYARSQVHVSLKKKDDGLHIIVEDDGIGIPASEREVIFDPFKRVDESRSRETGGFGIGLAIVKQVADWHQGEVTVNGSTLGGARFVFVLPPAL